MFLHFTLLAFFLVNCVVSQWSSCSKTCGPGTQQRSVQIPANYGGLQCPNQLTKPCNTRSCSKVPEVLNRLAGQVATAGGAFAVASFINLPPLPTTLASGIPPGKYAISYQSKYSKL